MSGTDSSNLSVGQVGLIALFVTALITSQVTATKLLGFRLPFSLPFSGTLLILPGASVAYSVTFFASDCYAELYGRRAAQVMVNVAFAMNFVLLGLVWTTLAAPQAPLPQPPASAFSSVLGASTNIVLGSLVAYVVSQNWDVIAFHRIREYTDGEHLWLRNVGSTATSQAIDTALFVLVAFVVAPAVLGIGQGLGLSGALGLVFGQYLLKVAIAVGDTPFVYAAVGLLESRETDVIPKAT
jgi:uncharacterized integral membrane protein (TIGR00697 family)